MSGYHTVTTQIAVCHKAIKIAKSNEIHCGMDFGVFPVYKHHFSCVTKGMGV